MAEGGGGKTENQEFEAIRALVPRLIDKLVPEEISDKLFSQRIITKDVYDSSFDRSLPLKERTRELVGCVLDAVEKNKSFFNAFCLILEQSKKPSIRELGKKLQDNLKKFEAKNEPDTPVSSHFQQLKQDLQFLQKSLLQSDEYIDEKYLLVKEAISKFVCQSLESGEQKESLHAKLEELCFVDIMVPQKLHNWCFINLDAQTKDPVSQSAGDETATNDPSPLFVKENVYHALLLANIASVIGSHIDHSFFTKNLHAFDEVSISTEDSKADNKDLKRYIIARKGKIFFVAFCGEPNLLFWQHEYSSLDEGICSQKDRIPTRFFVEYLRKEDGHQIIFTGFSFGGSLAMAVHAELWSQSCLRIDDLKANVACIGFGVPLFSLAIVKQIADDCPDIMDNTHLFYIQNDVFPCVLQCVDFPKPNEKSKKSSKKLYAGTISGDIIERLSQLQTIHNQSVKESESKDCLDALKVALEAAIPPTEVEVTIFGSVYYIFVFKDNYQISKITNQDQLQFLNARLSIDSLKADIFKKHSVQKYQSLVGESFLNSTDFGDKYVYPKQKLNPAQFEYVKPKVSRALFFRHADEIAIVLEGENLWFCHKIKIGAREEARIIEIDADGQDTTMRTINFCYIPKGTDDLLIRIDSKNVTITLFSHFCKPVPQRNVEAKKMADYAISFRQRQLARLTPTEVIRLSLVSAILERPSIKAQSTSRPSKRFETIRQFLEDATRIVPVESICHAIENESEENAWKCAEALINSEFEPQPSLIFMNSLINAHIRLTTGIRPKVLQRVEAEAIHRVLDGRFYPNLRTNIQVSDDKVVVTAENRLHDFSLHRRPSFKRNRRVLVGSPQQHVPLLFSDVVGEKKHSIAIHKDPPKHGYDNTQSSKQNVIVTKLQKMSERLARQFTSKKCAKTICGLNISELYSSKNNGSSTSLKPPIEFLKKAKSQLQALQIQAQDELSSLKSDEDTEDIQNSRWEHHNETMIEIINGVMSQEVAICLSLLGAFMECQMKVPFVNSPEQTAQILRTTQSSSAIGVWTLFSLNMINMQSLLQSSHGKLIVEVEKYVQGIIGQRQSDDHGRYAGKLQFLMVGMGQTVSCNTQYISYSLERQLTALCEEYEISAGDRVNVIVRNWNKTFSKSILFHVMVEYRPLLARWLLWSLNIHKLREKLASNTTVGIVGLSNSGKSCLVKGLFRQNAISGTTRIQRTTVPFLYNLEGAVDGLSIADFPGVDDKDKTVVGISKILLQLSQIVILVIDYKRISTQSAVEWIKALDNSGIPVLLCLTHADKFYANECIGKYGKDCSDKLAKRIIGKEKEDIKSMLPTCPNRTTFFCSFCQDADSFLDCEKGRERLSKVGISLQSDVGEWLIGILKHQLQQDDIAKTLDTFFSNNVHEPQQERVKEEKFPVPLELKESSIEMPKLLRSVNHVFWETALDIKRSGNDEYQYLKWEEYGLKLVIPPKALQPEAVYTIAVKAVSIEGYSLPCESEIVSAFYWVYSSHRFLKPVDLVIQHCARLEDKKSVSRMGFVTAPCNQDLPYKFVRKEGVFELQSRQGSFSTKRFSFFAIIRDYLFSDQESHTYYVFKVFGKKLSSQLQAWRFDFFFLKDIETYITAIDEKCSKAGWIEDVPSTSFDFEEGCEIIDVQMSDASEYSNWNIKKKCSSKIEKSHIDRSEVSTTQQSCRIAFQWKGRGSPSHIDYSVNLKGVVGSPAINLTIPLENDDAENDMSRGVPVIPNQEIPPNFHINIENKPVINVNTDIQS